jgi:hypothetical protein
MAGRLDPVAAWLDVRPALDAPELLAEPVRAALVELAPEHAARCTVAEVVDGLGLPA